MKLLASTLASVAFGYAADAICPSTFNSAITNLAETGCYTQIGKWDAKDVGPDKLKCEMDNKACLVVNCKARSMKAQLRYDLFQTNEKHDETFGKQLENKTRALFFGGTEL